MRVRGSTAVALVSAALVVAGSAPARAAAAPEMRFAAIPVQRSTFFGGYIAFQSKVTSASAIETVPELTACTSSVADAGLGPAVVIQGPKFTAIVGAEASCQDGTASYVVGIDFSGNQSQPLTVAPRDVLQLSLTEAATGTNVTVVDKTSGKRLTKKGPAGKVTNAEFGDDPLIDESTGKALPVPAFTDHGFSSCTVDGKLLGKARSLEKLELTEAGKLVDVPSSLVGDKAFVMHFTAS